MAGKKRKHRVPPENQRQWQYTLQDIAILAGQKIETVRRHKREGKLKPWDLYEVLCYINAVWRKRHGLSNP